MGRRQPRGAGDCPLFHKFEKVRPHSIKRSVEMSLPNLTFAYFWVAVLGMTGNMIGVPTEVPKTLAVMPKLTCQHLTVEG